MPAGESTIHGPINLRIEEAFVALIKANGGTALAELAIVPASDRDVLVPPLHCFVYCDQATPQLPMGPYYLANVAVTLVTDIDDHNTADRKRWWGRILKALSCDPQVFSHREVQIHGWSMQSQGEISDGRQTGDVARLRVGVEL